MPFVVVVCFSPLKKMFGAKEKGKTPGFDEGRDHSKNIVDLIDS